MALHKLKLEHVPIIAIDKINTILIILSIHHNIYRFIMIRRVTDILSHIIHQRSNIRPVQTFHGLSLVISQHERNTYNSIRRNSRSRITQYNVRHLQQYRDKHECQHRPEHAKPGIRLMTYDIIPDWLEIYPYPFHTLLLLLQSLRRIHLRHPVSRIPRTQYREYNHNKYRYAHSRPFR